MGLSILGRDDATAAAALAVDSGDTATPEQFLAATVRRAASLLCPTTPAHLIEVVTDVLRPISGEDAALGTDVAETLDALIGGGDLVETIDSSDGVRRRVVFLGSPRYVRRRSGDVVLLGVRPDAAPLVGEELARRIEHSGRLRRVRRTSDLDALLTGYGLQEVKASRWLRSPHTVPSDEFAQAYDDRLTAQASSGQIPDLRILDPVRAVAFYRGRWRAVDPGDTGRFVARRSQRYGADLWCYVEIRAGEPSRMIDLPVFSRDRGCDEAWRLQAAIDARRGAPQLITMSGTGTGRITLGLQAPPPRWLQRRWDLLGRPRNSKRALFAYDFTPADAREECDFAIARLWLKCTLTPKVDQR